MSVPEIIGYELWEQAPAAKVEDHYLVAVFDDADYAKDAAILFNRQPAIEGHRYYVIGIPAVPGAKAAIAALNIGCSPK